MKNKKFMGIFALASCVMLAGCGGEKPHEHSFPETWSNNSTQHWHECSCGEKSGVADHVDADSDYKCDVCGFEIPVPPVPVPAIEIKELPESLVSGDTIDLKDYVKTDDGGSFDLNFDDDSFAMIELDGTKVTVLEEGEVSFTVSHKGESKEGTLNVISLTRNKYVEWTTDVGYEYALFGADEEGFYLNNLHSEDFIYFDYFSEESGGGFAQIGDHVYQYTTDAELTKATAEPGYLSSTILEYYNLPIELDDSYAYTTKLSKSLFGYALEALEFGIFGDIDFTTEDVSEIVTGIFGLVDEFNDPKTGSHYVATAVDFVFDSAEEEDGSLFEYLMALPMYSSYNGVSYGKPYPQAGAYYVSLPGHYFFDETDLELDCVKEMIENEEVPDPYDYSVVKTALNGYVDTDNYTVTYDYGWFDSKGKALDPEDYPDMDGLVFQDCKDSLVAGHESTVVTSEAVSTYVEGDEGGYKESRGYLLKDEVVYNYSLYGTGYQAVETDYPSISAVGDERFAFLSTSSVVENELFPEDLIYTYDEDKEAYLMNVDAQNGLLGKLFKASATLSDIVTKVLDPYLIDYDRDIYSFFEGSVVIGVDHIDIEWDLMWDDNASFNVKITLEKQGSSVVPADILDAVKEAIK